jgi:hypothetical protein
VSTNPYQAPAAPLDSSTSEIAIPDDVAKRIKQCWIAGLVSGSITAAIAILVLSTGANVLNIDAWAFVDVAIMLALSYGVYRKSRTCAVLLLTFFVLNKIIMWMEAGAPSGWLLALVFIWFFGQGVIGTFQYHRLKRARQASA